MPNSKQTLIRRLESLEQRIMQHLIESGGIKTQLKFNTWLTGVILVALLTQFISQWFHHG